MDLNVEHEARLRAIERGAETSKRLVVVMSLLVILPAGTYFLVETVQKARRLDDLAARGVSQAAEVVTVAVGDQTVQVGYAYAVEGTEITVLDENTLIAAPVGASLTVLRHPDDPWLSRIDVGTAAASAARMWFWAGVAPLLCAVALWRFLRWRVSNDHDPATSTAPGSTRPAPLGGGSVELAHAWALWPLDRVADGVDRIDALCGYGGPIALLGMVLGLLPWWWAEPAWYRYLLVPPHHGSGVGPRSALSLVVSGGGGDEQAARAARWLRLGVVTTSTWLLWMGWVCL